MRCRPGLILRCVTLLTLLGPGACSVDERELALAPDAGGSGSAGSSGAGSNSEAGVGNAPGDNAAGMAGEGGGTGSSGGTSSTGGSSAGGSSASDGLVNGCADLDTDGVADCTTTAVENPSFKSDVESWLAATEATVAWSELNALADVPSGSAKLQAQGALARAVQCVPVPGKKLVIAYANAKVVAPAAESENVVAELEVSFFDSADCSGERSGYFETPVNEAAGAWSVVQAGGISAETSRSAAIALVGIRTAGSLAIEAYFDNVMLKLVEL